MSAERHGARGQGNVAELAHHACHMPAAHCAAVPPRGLPYALSLQAHTSASLTPPTGLTVQVVGWDPVPLPRLSNLGKWPALQKARAAATS